MKNIPPEKTPLPPDVLRLIVNLEKQIEEQKVQIQKIEVKTAQFEKNFRILVSELIHSGCINVPERRKMIKRSMINYEALTSLLKKKGVINSREFLNEIKQLVNKEKSIKKE
jgi:hypothetical protein